MFRYARSVNGLADAYLLESNVGQFKCVSCGFPMIAKTQGRIREKHFAHKYDAALIGPCSSETYLHIVAKNVFYLTFRESRRTGKPFLVELERKLRCPVAEAAGKECLKSSEKHAADLVGLFDTVRVEKKHGEFIPDPLLSHTETGLVCFVEVFVSSACTEEKRALGKPIIEIMVQSEEDIDRIASGNIPFSLVRGYHSNQLALPILKEPVVCCMGVFPRRPEAVSVPELLRVETLDEAFHHNPKHFLIEFEFGPKPLKAKLAEGPLGWVAVFFDGMFCRDYRTWEDAVRALPGLAQRFRNEVCPVRVQPL